MFTAGAQEHNVWIADLVPCNFPEFISSSHVLVNSLGFSIHRIISCANGVSLLQFQSECLLFLVAVEAGSPVSYPVLEEKLRLSLLECDVGCASFHDYPLLCRGSSLLPTVS